MGRTAFEELCESVERMIALVAGDLRDTLRSHSDAHGRFLYVWKMQDHLEQWVQICKTEAHDICDTSSLGSVFRDLDSVAAAVRRLSKVEALEDSKSGEQIGEYPGLCQLESAFVKLYEKRADAVREALKSEALMNFSIRSRHPKHAGRLDSIHQHRQRMNAENLALIVPFLPLSEESRKQLNRTLNPVDEFPHSADFTTVNWGEREFEFNQRQAACVCVMWNLFKKGTPFQTQDYIIENAAETYRETTAITIPSFYTRRLRDVFKVGKTAVHDAWNSMIVKGPGRAKNGFGLTIPVEKVSHDVPSKFPRRSRVAKK